MHVRLFEKELPLTGLSLIGHCPIMTEKKLLSPDSTAKRTKTSRSAVMRALQAHKLRGIRSNGNKWLIDPEDADRWAANRPISDRSVIDQRPDIQPSTHEDSIKLAAALAKIEGLEARLEDTRAERDRLEKLLEKSMDRRQGLFGWIFGTK